MSITHILILGGYGNFGKKIAETLSTFFEGKLTLAGRSHQKASLMCDALQSGSKSNLQPLAIDINSDEFEPQLVRLAPDLVIHTSGPFQQQDYRVPLACIQAGSHYIDLADDRRYVCDIGSLNELAEQHSVLVVSGASSVPGLSSVVVDHYLNEFSSLREIDFAIAPGNRAERGFATVKAILSYTGHAIKVWEQGNWQDVVGWMDTRRRDFGGPVGRRLVANVDIPDLELFPVRYADRDAEKGVERVRFQAGLELPFLHHAMGVMAWMAKMRLVPDWSHLARSIFRVSEWFIRFGTADGAMQVSLIGSGAYGKPKTLHWTLYAPSSNGMGVGPYIPTLSAIILTEKLIRGEMDIRGAYPCLGLYSLAEFEEWAARWGIYCEVVHQADGLTPGRGGA